MRLVALSDPFDPRFELVVSDGRVTTSALVGAVRSSPLRPPLVPFDAVSDGTVTRSRLVGAMKLVAMLP